MTAFSARLLHAARYAGIPDTQAGIAKALGLKRQTVNHWFLSGEPTAENLLEIAAKWNVSAEWLRSGEGSMLPAPTDLPAHERELLRDYRSATPQTRQLLRTMARAARKSVLFLVAMIPPLLSPTNSEAGTTAEVTAATTAPVYYVKWGRLLRWLQEFLTRQSHSPLQFRTLG